MPDPRQIVDSLVERLRPLETEANRAWWDAAVSGEPDHYARLEELRNRVDDLLADRGRFEALARAREDRPEDPLLARSIDLLYLEALPRQVDPALARRINRIATAIERAFATHRPLYRGERRPTNDLDRVLKTEHDQGLRREAYEALKSVGPIVAQRLIELVGLRNEAARSLGFDDFYRMRLALHEQDASALEGFLDRMDALTAEPFAATKRKLDAALADRFGLGAAPPAPWHYEDQFFQEAPAVFGADLDSVYAAVDILDVARRFFEGIGLPVAAVLERSSLYEADGKDPHAFATDIDREGDVRILLNLRANERWMGTTLHELGHAVYDEGISRELPWTLRRPAHTLSTEAVAMLFGRLSRDAAWLLDSGILDAESARRLAAPAAEELRATMLVLSRWVQVMCRFERDLYARPDQDLNARWWSLVERFQGIPAPPRPAGAADWAAKIHVVLAPVYYHNYLMGECLASQIEARLRADVLDGRSTYVAEPRVGEWLTEMVFRPGALLHYDEHARRATGSPVEGAAFARQFVAA